MFSQSPEQESEGRPAECCPVTYPGPSRHVPWTVPSRTLAVPSHTLGVPSRTLAVPSRTLGVPSRTLAVPSRTLAVPSRTLAVPSRTLGVSRGGGQRHGAEEA